MIRWVISALGYLLLTCASLAQVGQIPAWPPAQFIAGAAFQGPGDVVTSAIAWGSCARAYNAAYANGTNALCDLKDKTTGTVAICTLRVATTGFVDLAGSYCIGSTTPAVACAAAAGGSCIVSKAYDQTGNARDFTQATAANMPGLVFSALNGLPALQCGSPVQLVSPVITQAQPFSVSTVYIRTSGTATGSAVGAGAGTIVLLGSDNIANRARVGFGTNVAGIIATDNAWHAFQGTANGVSGAYNMDGVDTAAQNLGSTAFAGNAIRICTDSSQFLVGQVVEAGLWPSALSPALRTSLGLNQRSSANGYNF